jgi:hypothetical protein
MSVVGVPFTRVILGDTTHAAAKKFSSSLKGMITANIPFSERNKSTASIKSSKACVLGLDRALVIRFVIFGIKEGWRQLNHIRLRVLLQIHLSQHDNKIADHPWSFRNYLLLVHRRFRQFQEHQFAEHYFCASINAITPVPVPISKILNGLWFTGPKRKEELHLCQFSSRRVLFNENCLNWN